MGCQRWQRHDARSGEFLVETTKERGTMRERVAESISETNVVADRRPDVLGTSFTR